MAACLSLFSLNVAWADVGGKITGVVKDRTEAVIAGATVIAVNAATGVKQTTKTDAQGSYTFPVLPVGQYEIDVTADGFKSNETRGLTIDINTALTVDVTLQLSEQNENITVTENGISDEDLSANINVTTNRSWNAPSKHAKNANSLRS